jgi:hypothetical protein
MKIFLLANQSSKEEFKQELIRKIAHPHFVDSAEESGLIVLESPLFRGEAYGLFSRFKGAKQIFMISKTMTGISLTVFRGVEK